MKIKKTKTEQGIKVKSAGLTENERKIIVNAIRKIQYGRKKENRPSLPYVMKLK